MLGRSAFLPGDVRMGLEVGVCPGVIFTKTRTANPNKLRKYDLDCMD
jgi:hypothetical protein